MVSVTSGDGSYIFEIKGWHKLWAFQNRITIPKAKIIRAYQNSDEFTIWKGLRMPGTEVPGLIAAGTFYKDGRNFWDVMNTDNAIIVELYDHYYKKLIIEVENPTEVLYQLNTK
ncbi:hypothetical protein [Flavobacterium caseinilyticum]|uniref:Uncharacterized protein n=1 Tax=Flavobacterium caseinilyticum TaxID=2541732 RepID=A0A4R5AWB6_9FLAO|nr:hypothetical protein [Flavobacterium caseinilyticum]TDD76016.1 hypothetical protein E0F89_10685 [Flavobacterium caseinilyticum]